MVFELISSNQDYIWVFLKIYPLYSCFLLRQAASKAVQSDDELREFVRQHTQSLYHPVGTCKMGVDSMAVVNPELQVHGVQGLRVVDASIMPNIVNANTNAPTIAIAEKAAEMISRT